MTPPTASVRLETYKRFAGHNRRVAMLRWVVPVGGLLILAVPAIQLALSMAADAIPIEGIRLENDTLVIDGPTFEGRTATGTNYAMVSDRAETRVGDLDTVDLFGLRIDLAGNAGYEAEVEFTTATWTMSTEYLTSNEDVAVSDSTGARGILAGVEVDWPNQMITSDGPIRFNFDSGAQLVADTMVHDIDAARWQFTRVSLDMVPQDDSGAERDPFAVEAPDAEN
ncbi:hypothetical protein [Pelagibacterium luteolum]|uniref:Lipopolysaccharide export system protein LptC n=1 Tax=Pelagibacterium luteolum TaxID=440168 RepID=A0A1G7SNK6_9HYPH|nr:hypothetical protein [Pelagibacterium luteolum]SDG24424.1 lipopolysaccharide export system protein LptC [Pelagibacterium luteolum]